jgi:hypothetical protein
VCDLRYPVPPRGVFLMSINACGSPAHPDSVCVVSCPLKPPKKPPSGGQQVPLIPLEWERAQKANHEKQTHRQFIKTASKHRFLWL